ncbi:MAG: hypothetical protein MMC33_009485 [Icmadophila ericetorum]|nr:hypothetical protein [Icmadophila ericetorum]
MATGRAQSELMETSVTREELFEKPNVRNEILHIEDEMHLCVDYLPGEKQIDDLYEPKDPEEVRAMLNSGKLASLFALYRAQHPVPEVRIVLLCILAIQLGATLRDDDRELVKECLWQEDTTAFFGVRHIEWIADAVDHYMIPNGAGPYVDPPAVQIEPVGHADHARTMSGGIRQDEGGTNGGSSPIQ